MEDTKQPSPLVPLSTLLDAELERLERSSDASGRKLGWTEFDERVGPLRPGQVVVVASPRGMGTTAFAVNVALRWVASPSAGAVYFALDVGSTAMARRFLTCAAGVDITRVEEGTTTASDRDELREAAARLREAPLSVDATPGLSLDELDAHYEHTLGASKTEAPSLVVVDGFEQLRTASGDETSDEALLHKAELLCSFAQKHQVTLLVTATAFHPGDPHGYGRLRPEHVSAGWALRRHADILLLLHRPAYYVADEDPHLMEVLLTQHPEKRRCSIPFDFEASMRLCPPPTRDEMFADLPE